MTTSKVSQIGGVRFTQGKVISDNRGAFIKFHPLRDLTDLKVLHMGFKLLHLIR